MIDESLQIFVPKNSSIHQHFPEPFCIHNETNSLATKLSINIETPHLPNYGKLIQQLSIQNLDYLMYQENWNHIPVPWWNMWAVVKTMFSPTQMTVAWQRFFQERIPTECLLRVRMTSDLLKGLLSNSTKIHSKSSFF